MRSADSETLARINAAGRDPESNVYTEGDINEEELKVIGSYAVTDAFYDFLAEQTAWKFANGRFEREMIRRMRR